MINRVLAIAVGLVLALGGAVVAFAGGALMFLLGSDSTLTTGQEQVTTSTSALVTPIDDIAGTRGVTAALGAPVLRVSATGTSRQVFIGVGPAAAVDSYLAGAAIDRVRDLELDPFALRSDRREGSARPGSPEAQTFWLAKGSGTNPSLNWKIRDGSYRLVVMNSDASPGVSIDGRFGLTVPHLFGFGISALVGGAVATFIGVLLFVFGLRTPRRPSGMGHDMGIVLPADMNRTVAADNQ